MKKTIVFIILILIFINMLAFAEPGDNESDGDSIIDVKSDNNFPPYEFLENGVPVGFIIDLIYAVADAANIEINLKTDKWEIIRAELENGEIDMLSAMFYSKNRDEILDFSQPYLILSHSIFVRNGSDIKNLEDARDKFIIVQKGDVAYDFLVENNITDKIIEVENKEEAILLLSSGSYDCALLSKFNAYYLINKNKVTNLKAVGNDIAKMDLCFAVLEGDEELVQILNDGLTIVKASGVYQEIYNKWFGEYEQISVNERVRRIIFYSVIPIVFIIGLILFWSYSLKKEVRKKTQELVIGKETLEERVKERTKTLLEIQSKLIESEKTTVYSNLVIGVSHEMNTPLGNSITLLTFVISKIKHLKEKYEDQTLKASDLEAFISSSEEAGNKMKHSLEQMVHIINIFKSLDVTSSLNRMSTFNVYQLINSVITFVKVEHKFENIEFVIKCDESIEIESYFDALFQVVYSLVENAFIHGFNEKTSGFVEIEFIENVDDYKIIVTDNGLGIEDDIRSKIFDYFFSKDHSLGTGLGLNRVYNLVTFLLDGKLNLESSLGEGTKITVSWRKNI